MIDGAGRLANYGRIFTHDNGTAVWLRGGGTVSNGALDDTSAIIAGQNGVELDGGGTIENFARIVGSVNEVGAGVVLGQTGVLANGSAQDHVALVEGYNGIEATDATIVNYGTLAATGGVGSGIFGSFFTNGSVADAAAIIEGYQGADVELGGVLTNFGTISGSGGTAVRVDASATLKVEAGSAFLGNVEGGGGTLILASGAEDSERRQLRHHHRLRLHGRDAVQRLRHAGDRPWGQLRPRQER